jgi:hypothetical protein
MSKGIVWLNGGWFVTLKGMKMTINVHNPNNMLKDTLRQGNLITINH